jgi:hypothetical protein
VDAGFYLTPDEPVPYRPAKSKSFIPKVMFFAANAKPRYDPHKLLMNLFKLFMMHIGLFLWKNVKTFG